MVQRSLESGGYHGEHDRQRSLEQTIRIALNGLRYGSIEFIIHDSKIVRIERKEKIRPDELYDSER